MRILITGVTGFVGGHLVQALADNGADELHGFSRSTTWPVACDTSVKVTLHAVDLTGPTSAIAEALAAIRPQQIYHLAGYAKTGESFREPEAAWQGNLTATRHLYDAVVQCQLRPRILFVGSGLIYGDPERTDTTCDENTPLKPANPYAASKAAADLVSYQYTRSPGLDIVRARPFNHIGARQSADYAIANFARQIAAIEAGEQIPVIETGDLSAGRDLADVRDVVQAYRLLMQRGRTGEAYNVATGRTHRIAEVLQRMVALAKVPMEIRQKVDPQRKGDTAVTRASIDKIHRELGWQPTYSLEDTLATILDDWRQRTTQRLRQRSCAS